MYSVFIVSFVDQFFHPFIYHPFLTGADADAPHMRRERDPADTHHEARVRHVRLGRSIEPQPDFFSPQDEHRALRRGHSGEFCFWTPPPPPPWREASRKFFSFSSFGRYRSRHAENLLGFFSTFLWPFRMEYASISEPVLLCHIAWDKSVAPLPTAGVCAAPVHSFYPTLPRARASSQKVV